MKIFITLIVLVLLINPVYSQDTLDVPQEYATIQQAINSAAAGDIVLVAEGTYFENINFIGKAITVASHFILDQDTSHISATIINGSLPSHKDSGSVVLFNSGEDTTSVLTGFTITGGKGTRTTGKKTESGIWRMGGGIFLLHSAAAISNNIIKDNVITDSIGTYGGGIAVEALGVGSDYLIIRDNVITNNKCESSRGTGGGGVYIWMKSTVMENNIISNNSIYYTGSEIGSFGGGIHICGFDTVSYSSFLFMKNNHISANKITSTNNLGGWGGGIDIQAVQLDFRDNIINNNSVTTLQYAYGTGARVLFCSPNSKVTKNTFIDNTPDQLVKGQGGGILAISDSLLIAENKFIGNKAEYGGGILLYSSDGVPIERNTFYSNLATQGGAFNASLSDFIFQNNIVNQNKALYGGGLYISASTEKSDLDWELCTMTPHGQNNPARAFNGIPLVINNTIVNNTASTTGGAVRSNNSGAVLVNNILWGNTAPSGSQIYEGGTPLTVTYNDIEGGYTGLGNINANPLFCDTSFQIPQNSPCIDAGVDSIMINGVWVYAPETDFYGNQRLGITDIGAVEDCQLPVELVSFNGFQSNNGVLLKWSTATEINNFGFEVERKSSEEFITVGFVKGNGSTTETINYLFTDENCGEGKFYYRLKQVDFNGAFEYSPVIEVEVKPAGTFFLDQNYPNPFNPSTTISYGIMEKGNVKIAVFNALGEEVSVLIDEQKEPGIHIVEFDASKLPSGLYLYQLHSGKYLQTKKMLLIK